MKATCAVVACALVATTSACSWFVVEGPPRHPRIDERIACDEKSWAVSADLGGFGGLLLGGLLTGLALAANDDPGPAAVALVAGMGTGASLYGASAYYGRHQIRRCHSLIGKPFDPTRVSRTIDGDGTVVVDR